MTRLHQSPLGAELDAARDDGRAEVLELAGRRRPTVRATRLPGSERERAFRLVVQLLDQAVDDMVHDRGIGDG